MAGTDFSNVAGNEDISRIAEAIRTVTRSSEPMTIPQMPGRLVDVRVVEAREAEVSFTAESEALGRYDKALKHLFLVMPKDDASAHLLADAEASIELVYDASTGDLSVSHAEKISGTATVIVADLLLPSTAATIGVLVGGVSAGGSASILAYSSSKSYAVGDIFLYEGVLGVTTVAHGPEALNASHNKLMATKYVVQEQGSQTWVDLFDLSQRIAELETETAGIGDRLADVEGLVPSEATPQNKLADKNYVDFGLDRKAGKVSSAMNGNLAGLDTNGNLTDSGVASVDVSVAVSFFSALTQSQVSSLKEFAKVLTIE